MVFGRLRESLTVDYDDGLWSVVVSSLEYSRKTLLCRFSFVIVIILFFSVSAHRRCIEYILMTFAITNILLPAPWTSVMATRLNPRLED